MGFTKETNSLDAAALPSKELSCFSRMLSNK